MIGFFVMSGMKGMDIMKKGLIQKSIVLVFFTFLFILGICLFKDYGISTDEPRERETTFLNLNYVLETVKNTSGSEDLEDYRDKYYGIAMQAVPAVIEVLLGLEEPDVFLIRHLWTFLVCFAGYVCFYLLCRKIHLSRGLSLLGTAMLCLYPRFFAEQFYNIKDMMFTAMVMISMFCTVMVIEKRYSLLWTAVFSIAAALTANVRIVGVIFPILLLGYIWLEYMLNEKENREIFRVLRVTLLIVAFYLVTYILLMPSLWKNPFKGMAEVFIQFSNFDNWDGNIVFMGRVIKREDLPWYYIPVWLLISLPIWYWILFLAAAGSFAVRLLRIVRRHGKITKEMFFENKYVIWAWAIAFLPWFAMVVVHSTLYNGWRHCYFLLPPLVLLMLEGLNCQWLRGPQTKWTRKLVMVIVVFGLINQIRWIVVNHPYEMVYLNTVGKHYGADFDRDYWYLANVSLSRYILDHDDSEKITIKAGNSVFLSILEKEEKARLVWEEENPTYYIESYRAKTGNCAELKGYEEYYAVIVDGYRIATVFKKA